MALNPSPKQNVIMFEAPSLAALNAAGGYSAAVKDLGYLAYLNDVDKIAFYNKESMQYELWPGDGVGTTMVYVTEVVSPTGYSRMSSPTGGTFTMSTASGFGYAELTVTRNVQITAGKDINLQADDVLYLKTNNQITFFDAASQNTKQTYTNGSGADALAAILASYSLINVV